MATPSASCESRQDDRKRQQPHARPDGENTVNLLDLGLLADTFGKQGDS
jgi:hypothetical protein